MIVACGGKTGGDSSASAAKSAAPTAKGSEAKASTSSPAKAASAAPSASPAAKPSGDAIEVTLKDRDRQVKVKFDAPKGWQRDPMGARESSVVFQGTMQSLFTVGLTCQGDCAEAKLKENIEKKAQEDFGNFKGSAEWIDKPKEDPKGTISFAFFATNAEKKKVEQVAYVDHLLPGQDQFLECRVKVDDREPDGTFETLRNACKSLTFEALPK